LGAGGYVFSAARPGLGLVGFALVGFAFFGFAPVGFALAERFRNANHRAVNGRP
jgi:hypothetical protein